MFESELACPPRPSSDVFNYIFHHGRWAYLWNRVLYRVDGSDETLTLAQLEQQSRQFADAAIKRYGIRPNNVIGILARDRVNGPFPQTPRLHLIMKLATMRCEKIIH
jgi:4-coumarate--CoA ligase